jgi:hypothetical protein
LGAAAGFAACLAQNARGFVNGFLAREGREFRWTVFLKDGADQPLIEKRLLTLPGVRAARFVGKEEALGRAQDVPALAEGLKLAARNPLPASFEVSWDNRFLRPDLLVPAADKMAEADGVLRVGYDRSRLDRLALLSRLAGQIDAVEAVILWAAVAAIVFWAAWILFGERGPLEWRTPAGGAVAGFAGGAAGASVASVWLGAFHPAGLLAGFLLGAAAGLGRSVGPK